MIVRLVQWHDAGVRLSWCDDDHPDRIHVIDLPVDHAAPLAHAIQQVTDGGEVDTRSGAFKVQWWAHPDGGGVQLLHQLNSDDGTWERLQLSMDGARGVAAAILQAIDDRDVMVIHDGDVAELPETEERTYPPKD